MCSTQLKDKEIEKTEHNNADQWRDYRKAVIILSEESLLIINARFVVINNGFAQLS